MVNSCLLYPGFWLFSVSTTYKLHLTTHQLGYRVALTMETSKGPIHSKARSSSLAGWIVNIIETANMKYVRYTSLEIHDQAVYTVRRHVVRDCICGCLVSALTTSFDPSTHYCLTKLSELYSELPTETELGISRSEANTLATIPMWGQFDVTYNIKT